MTKDDVQVVRTQRELTRLNREYVVVLVLLLLMQGVLGADCLLCVEAAFHGVLGVLTFAVGYRAIRHTNEVRVKLVKNASS